jgi:hypothetical protein
VTGRRLVDLVNELERRLTGSAPGPGLAPDLASLIPHADTYVLGLFDGLGHHQLGHASAKTLAEASVGVLTAPFPSTTTVSMATISTGTEAAAHGVVGHLMWIPQLDSVVNVLKWVTLAGQHTGYPTGDFLPEPNLWERLRANGIEPITVQPGDFVDTPLTRLLYRGCRFEPVYSVDEAVDATSSLAGQPGRFVFVYFPQVDFAAHVWGQRSTEYTEALRAMDTAWSRLVARVPAPVVGTADHGHVDYDERSKLMMRDPVMNAVASFGDARALFLNGPEDAIVRVGETYGIEAHLIGDGADLWPGVRHPELRGRLPDAVLLAPDGKVLLPRGFDRRLTGYHGGLSPEEIDIPLLVG